MKLRNPRGRALLRHAARGVQLRARPLRLHRSPGRAKAALGPRFDIKAFHDAVLSTGRGPLDILRSEGERWIAAQRA
jgi:hypothetical protein